MANNTVAEIVVSQGPVTGAIFWAVAGTALPTDSTTALAVAYKNLGYVGAAGITPARTTTTDDVRDMNGRKLRTLQTDFGKTYAAELLQTVNVDLNKLIYGDSNVTATAATVSTGTKLAVLDKGILTLIGVMVIETTDGLGKLRRVCPAAQVVDVTEPALLGTAVQSYTATFSLYPDSSGVYDYKYWDNGVFAP